MVEKSERKKIPNKKEFDPARMGGTVPEATEMFELDIMDCYERLNLREEI